MKPMKIAREKKGEEKINFNEARRKILQTLKLSQHIRAKQKEKKGDENTTHFDELEGVKNV